MGSSVSQQSHTIPTDNCVIDKEGAKVIERESNRNNCVIERESNRNNCVNDKKGAKVIERESNRNNCVIDKGESK